MESDFVEQVFKNVFVVIMLHNKHMDILKHKKNLNYYNYYYYSFQGHKYMINIQPLKSWFDEYDAK